MNSAIYCGKVWHKRFSPRQHEFSYPSIMLALDLGEAPSCSNLWPLFSIDGPTVLALRSGDYLPHLSGSLFERVVLALRQTKPEAPPPSRIILITAPRYFGYVFNPVSFFACFDERNNIFAVVIEVHNTFGETFVYCPWLEGQGSQAFGPVTFKKAFYVSPFLEVQGEYLFHLREFGQRLHIQVDLSQDGNKILSTALTGGRSPLTRGNLAYLLLRYPFSVALTMLRIQWQAIQLYFWKKIELFEKDSNPQTPPHARKPGLISGLRLWIISLGRKCRSKTQ